MAGAFGAHGLRPRLTPELMQTWETAAGYQLAHAIVLLILAVAGTVAPALTGSAPWRWSQRCFLAGVLIFSGSLYLLVLTGIDRLGAITPLGGILLVVAWLILAAAALGRLPRPD